MISTRSCLRAIAWPYWSTKKSSSIRCKESCTIRTHGYTTTSTAIAREPRSRIRSVRGTAMEREANYVAVGAFMLVLIALAVAFVLWYSKAGDSHNYTMYEINFEGSVSGLSQGGQVRYL